MQDNPWVNGGNSSGVNPLSWEQMDELQQLYDHAPCGYHSLDENGVFIRINQTELAMLGYSREEIIGNKKFFDLLTSESQQKFSDNFPLFKQRGWIRDLEFRLICKNGDILPISLSSTAIKDEAGKYVMSRSVAIDISDRKAAETQLLLTEARLRYLLTSNPAVLYTCQATDDYAATFISENIRTMLGYESREFLEDSNFWASHIHPEDAPQVFAGLTHLFDQGGHTHEYRFLHQDGSYRWVLDELKLVRDVEGNPLEIVGYWIDITDRKQFEQKIIEQANLLAIATDAIFVHDLDNRILFWNQGAERLYGWQASEITGKDWQVLLSPDTLFDAETVIRQGTWQGEVPKVTKEGKEVVAMSRRSLMLDEAGQPKSILTVDTDITEKNSLSRSSYGLSAWKV
jgi:PAS domain S-box-containing protein